MNSNIDQGVSQVHSEAYIIDYVTTNNNKHNFNLFMGVIDV